MCWGSEEGCIDNNGENPIGRLGDRKIGGAVAHNGNNQRERKGAQ